MKIINSAAYEDIADHVILTMNDIQNYARNNQLLRKDAVIYCKTDFTPILFKLLAFSGRSYKLITHHSDYPIDHQRFNSKPSCIKKWYAINPTHKHPDLIPIPLGTKTPESRAYHEPQYKMKWFEENRERLFNNEKSMIVYCNWSDTNPERNKIIEKLKVQSLRQSGLSFETYCEQMSLFKFVISPPGNGLDNHRTWEALYLGCIPIVIKNPIYDVWGGLPILQVNDYSELTDKMLEEYLDGDCSYEMLDFEYWKNKIL